MKNDRIFILLLVILLPLTGCLDAVGEVDADSEENSGNTIVNNFYNNTSTTVQPEGPEMVHMYVITENNSVGTITIEESQTIEWVDHSSLLDFGEGPTWVDNPSMHITEVSCIDSDSSYYGHVHSGFAIKGEGECTYTLSTNYGSSLESAHHSLVYLIHEL